MLKENQIKANASLLANMGVPYKNPYPLEQSEMHQAYKAGYHLAGECQLAKKEIGLEYEHDTGVRVFVSKKKVSPGDKVAVLSPVRGLQTQSGRIMTAVVGSVKSGKVHLKGVGLVRDESLIVHVV